MITKLHMTLLIHTNFVHSQYFFANLAYRKNKFRKRICGCNNIDTEISNICHYSKFWLKKFSISTNSLSFDIHTHNIESIVHLF